MADDNRTLTLTIKAEIEAARQQLGQLADVLGTTSQQVDKRLTNIEESFSKSNTRISKGALTLATTIGSTFGTVIGNLVARIPSALQDIATSAIESASSVKNTAEALGIGTGALQDFRIGAVKAGVEVAQADKALDAFQKTTGRAAAGNKEAVAAFAAVGVSIADANGNLKPFDQLIREVADGITKIPDPARQAAAATKLFNDAGVQLLPFLRGGSQGMNDLAAASEALGLKLSPETINKLDDLGNKSQAIKDIINAQLAAAIGENADAFLALGNGAQHAIVGVAGLVREMRGIKVLVERGDLNSLLFKDDPDFAKIGTPRGKLDYANERLANAKAERRRPELIAKEQAFRDAALEEYLNSAFSDISLGSGTAVPGSPVTLPVGKPPPRSRAAAAKAVKPSYSPAELRGQANVGPQPDFSGALVDANGKIKPVQEALEAIKVDLGDIGTAAIDLQGAQIFDYDELAKVHLVSQQIVGDLAQGIAGIITQSGNLGDKLLSVFSRIGESILQSGLLNFFSGGEQGVSFGTLFKGVGKVSKLLGFASGGDPPVGVPSIVGENGPELIVPRGAMTVISNQALRAASRMAGGGGGGAGGVTNYNDFRGAVVTEELYRRIDATGQRAAQLGAIGGRQLAAADNARRARRRMY